MLRIVLATVLITNFSTSQIKNIGTGCSQTVTFNINTNQTTVVTHAAKPSLAITGTPTIGSTLRAMTTGLGPMSTILLGSELKPPLDMGKLLGGSSCIIYVAPLVPIQGPNATLPIPNDPSLRGRSFFLQGTWTSMDGPSQGLIILRHRLTNAVEITIQ